MPKDNERAGAGARSQPDEPQPERVADVGREDLRTAFDVPYRQRLLRAEAEHAAEVRKASEASVPPMGDPPNPPSGYVSEVKAEDDKRLAEVEEQRRKAGAAEAERAERVAEARRKMAEAELDAMKAEHEALKAARA